MLMVVPAAKELLKVTSILGRVEEKRRLEIATYIDKIADCIGGIADLADRDRNSTTLRRLCSELAVYGDQASDAIQTAVGHRGDRVIFHLNSAQDAPGFAIDGLISTSVLESDARRQAALRTLQEAAGHMRGVANTLRTPQTPVSFWQRLFKSAHGSK
jgi:hypothetical protein